MNILFIKFKIDPSDNNSVDKKSARHVFDDFIKLFNFNNNIQTYLDTNDYTKHIDRKFKPREACKHHYHSFIFVFDLIIYFDLILNS